MHKKFSRGFTLIELLVVMAIVGLLASIVMVSLSGAKSKSRDAKRQADIKSIQLALSLYYADNATYPKNIYSTSASPAPLNGLAPAYLPNVPMDPQAQAGSICTGGVGPPNCYKYMSYSASSANCTASNPVVTYHLGAGMEDTQGSGVSIDVDADNGGAYVYTSYTPCTVSPAGQATFNGNAQSCSGSSAMTSPDDWCYDVAP